MHPSAIRTEGLTKFYGAHRGIEDLDLSVARGEVFGFLGPNGAGKTTTIRLLLDLIRPTRGSARVLGLDCRTESLQVRRRIGYLPGEYRLYENLQGRQVLGFLGGLGDAVPRQRVESLAERLGIDLDREVRTLSHGNKQKLAIILAFMHDPDLLILDEPTNGLDPLVQQVFFGLIHEARARGAAVFLSSHNLSEVEKVCDRVASVRAGRLIAVEDIAAIRHGTVRLIELTCARPPAPAAFAAIEGMADVSFEGTVLRCAVKGAVGAVIAAAEPFGIVDLISREPSLEEFFLAMYGEAEVSDAR